MKDTQSDPPTFAIGFSRGCFDFKFEEEEEEEEEEVVVGAKSTLSKLRRAYYEANKMQSFEPLLQSPLLIDL